MEWVLASQKKLPAPKVSEAMADATKAAYAAEPSKEEHINLNAV